MAVRQVRRKIIGAEHSHDAMRLVSHRGSCAHASFKPLLSCSFSIGGNGNLHLVDDAVDFRKRRSEEHTSELQSLMRISYAVFCLKKKTTNTQTHTHYHIQLYSCTHSTSYINTHIP